jgi:hypothetical protein
MKAKTGEVILTATITNLLLALAWYFGSLHSEVVFVSVPILWAIISAPLGILLTLIFFIAIHYAPWLPFLKHSSLSGGLIVIGVALSCGTYFNALYFSKSE